MHWNIIEKETIDEVIFKTTEARNLLLHGPRGYESQEVLNLIPNDVNGRRLIIRDSKGGRGEEVVFISPKPSLRLRDYISMRRIEWDKGFSLCCSETDCQKTRGTGRDPPEAT